MKNFKTFGLSFFVFMLALLLFQTPAYAKGKITLNKSKTSIYMGNTCKISIKNAKAKQVKWKTSNAKVATINKKKGTAKVTVTGKKAGKATISATYGKKTYKCKITVKKPYLSSTTVALAPNRTSSVKLKGAVSTAKISITDWDKLHSKSNTKKKIFWAVQDSDIVSLSQKSDSVVKLTARKVGTTTIKAKYMGKTYSCTVTVAIPEYWNEEIQDSLTSAKALRRCSDNVAEFIYLTDTHWNSNAKQSPAIVNYLVKKLDIPFAAFGGDVITGYHPTAEEAEEELKDFYSQFDVNVFSTTGNHDSNMMDNPDPFTILSEDRIFELMYRKENLFANTGNTANHAYYDDLNHKVRYLSFYLDAHHSLTDETRNWIDTRISELGEGWSVVLFSHAYWKPSAGKADNRLVPEAANLASHLAALDKEVPAEIAVWMVGHIHRDLDTVIETPDGEGSLLVISTNCDTYKKSTYWGGLTMEKGTDTEQVIDIVQLDTIHKRLYLTRVGAGEDRTFQYR